RGDGWRKSAKNKLNEHFAHTAQNNAIGSAERTRGGAAERAPARRGSGSAADGARITGTRRRPAPPTSGPRMHRVDRWLPSCVPAPGEAGNLPYLGGGGASTVRSPLCSGADTTPAASIASTSRAARLSPILSRRWTPEMEARRVSVTTFTASS